jgi:hypothetical protein
MIDEQLKILDDFLNSPEGEAFALKFIEEENEREAKAQAEYEKNKEEVLAMFNSYKSFDELMNKLIDEHSFEVREKYYALHPVEEFQLNRILRTIFQIAEENNNEIESIDEFCGQFSSITYEYNRWQFATVFGQGCAYRVYFKNELMLSI